jgi:hypothetical protein
MRHEGAADWTWLVDAPPPAEKRPASLIGSLFAVLMLFFVLANLAGMGLKPFRYTGLPFVVAAWGFFDWSALALNLGVAVVVSGVVAFVRGRGAAAADDPKLDRTIPNEQIQGCGEQPAHLLLRLDAP